MRLTALSRLCRRSLWGWRRRGACRRGAETRRWGGWLWTRQPGSGWIRSWACARTQAVVFLEDQTKPNRNFLKRPKPNQTGIFWKVQTQTKPGLFLKNQNQTKLRDEMFWNSFKKGKVTKKQYAGKLTCNFWNYHKKPGLSIETTLFVFFCRVLDPHWSGSSIFPNCGSGDPIPNPGFWRPKITIKFTAVKFFHIFFITKIAIYLSLGLHKGRTSYRPQKRTSSTAKHENSFFFLYLWVILALLDPDPDPATHIDADPCGSGSGSKTLLFWKTKTKPNWIKRWIVLIQLRQGHKNSG